MLDLTRLHKLRRRGDGLIAQCPACHEAGGDRRGEHLSIDAEGRFACIVNTGPEGHAHRQRIFALVGSKRIVLAFTLHPPKSAKPAKRPLRIPSLRPLTITEMAHIAHELRGWCSFLGLEELNKRDLLWFGMVWDDGREWPAWIITGSTRNNAQARRMDGQPWSGIGNSKAKSLPGSDPTWPIGASEIGNRPAVILCEGQPDFCAALLVAWWEGLDLERIAPVCITGAGNTIHTAALPLFAGRHVRIAIHNDTQGHQAAAMWARQLLDAGAANVDGFDFHGLTKPDRREPMLCPVAALRAGPVNDLADFATLLDLENPPSACATTGL